MRLRIVVLAGIVLGAGGTQPAAASEFTNKDFLKLSKVERDMWLEGAILTAGHVVRIQNVSKAQCIWDWYVNSPSRTQATIFAAMQKYPDAYPTSTLIALMRHACGKPLIQ